MEIDKLIESAFDAQKNAYAPYSKFKVGCAVQTKAGKIFCGANIENASYPAGICAERVAISKAISEGYRTFEAIAITCDGNDYPYPCGVCRQFLSEFGNMKVIVARSKTDYMIYDLADLIPNCFNKNQLS